MSLALGAFFFLRLHLNTCLRSCLSLFFLPRFFFLSRCGPSALSVHFPVLAVLGSFFSFSFLSPSLTRSGRSREHRYCRLKAFQSLPCLLASVSADNLCLAQRPHGPFLSTLRDYPLIPPSSPRLLFEKDLLYFASPRRRGCPSRRSPLQCTREVFFSEFPCRFSLR